MINQGLKAFGQLELQVMGEDRGFLRIEAPAFEGYILGRSDTNNTYLPDIDLAHYKAHLKGVSRRHAALVRYQEYICVLDLSSVNGTFINNERLAADVPYPINDGDKLRLGNLTIQIHRITES